MTQRNRAVGLIQRDALEEMLRMAYGIYGDATLEAVDYNPARDQYVATFSSAHFAPTLPGEELPVVGHRTKQ